MDSSAPGRIYFNTDALPERDRFPAFCEEFVRRHTSLDIVRPDNGRPFSGAIELWRAGPVELSRNFNTPTNFVRSPYLLRDGNDALVIAVIRSGGAYQTQRGDNLKLGPGDGVVCDNAHPGRFGWPTDGQWMSVVIPRTTINKLVLDADRLAGAKLDRDDVARRLLFGYLSGTLDVESDGGRRAMQLYGEHILDLVALALGAEGDAGEMAEQRGGRAARRSAILHEIERRSSDSGLSAITIALLLGITPRYVHLLLEETGKSFTHHVLERRLDKAAALLRNPRWRHRKIADIAAEAGFIDLSYFNRAFRRHFGATPSDIRVSAVNQA
jgi:AraC-like DNA-binding protein